MTGTVPRQGNTILDNLTIKPKLGLGPISFGDPPSAIRRVLGTDYAWEEWMDCGTECLFYPGLVFHFDRSTRDGPSPASFLTTIQIRQRGDCILIDRPMTDWSRPELERYFEHHAIVYSRHLVGALAVIDWAMEIGVDASDRCEDLWMEPQRLEYWHMLPWWKRVIRTLGFG